MKTSKNIRHSMVGQEKKTEVRECACHSKASVSHCLPCCKHCPICHESIARAFYNHHVQLYEKELQEQMKLTEN